MVLHHSPRENGWTAGLIYSPLTAKPGTWWVGRIQKRLPEAISSKMNTTGKGPNPKGSDVSRGTMPRIIRLSHFLEEFHSTLNLPDPHNVFRSGPNRPTSMAIARASPHVSALIPSRFVTILVLHARGAQFSGQLERVDLSRPPNSLHLQSPPLEKGSGTQGLECRDQSISKKQPLGWISVQHPTKSVGAITNWPKWTVWSTYLHGKAHQISPVSSRRRFPTLEEGLLARHAVAAGEPIGAHLSLNEDLVAEVIPHKLRRFQPELNQLFPWPTARFVRCALQLRVTRFIARRLRHDQPPASPQKGCCTLRDDGRGAKRANDHPVKGPSVCRLMPAYFGSFLHHSHPILKMARDHRPLEKLGPSLVGLEEDQCRSGPLIRQDQTRQASARPKVQDSGARCS